MRKFLSLALALVMVLGLVPAMLPAAQAAEAASLYTDATVAPAALAAANIDGVISEGEYSASFDAYRATGNNPPIVKYYLAPTSIDLHFAVEMQIDVSGMTDAQKASLGDNITVETQIYRGDYRAKTDTDPGFVTYTSGMSSGAYKLYYRQAVDNALKSHTATSTRLKRTIVANDETNVYTVVMEHRYQMDNHDLINETSTTDNAAGVYTISSKITLTDGTNTLGTSYFAPGLTGDVSSTGYYENGYYVTNSSYVEPEEPEVPDEPEVPAVVYGVDFEIINCAYGTAKLALIGDGSYSFTLNGTSNGKTYTKADAPRTLNGLSSGGTLTVTRVEDGAALTISFSRPGALTGTFGTTKATSPATADGTITGVTDGVAYEINSVSDATTDANWTAATVENGAIVGLVPGSYYIRCAGYMDEAANTYYLPTRAYAEALVVGSVFELAATPVYGTDVTIDCVGYDWMILTFKTPGTYAYENSQNSNDATVVVDDTTGPVSVEMKTNAANIVTITRVGDGVELADSLPLTIVAPSRETQPTDVLTAVNATTSDAADGKITGIDAAKNYEINSVTNDNSSKDWTAATVVDGAIANLVPGTYYVRVAGYINEDGTYVLASKPYDGALVVGADAVVEEPTVVYGVDFEIINCIYNYAQLSFIGDGTYSFELNGTSNGKTYTKADAPRSLNSLSSGGTLTVTRVEDGAALTITFNRPGALTGAFGTTNATAPDAADGTITGVTDGVAYEINSVSDATGDTNWTAAKVENGAIVGLAAGSYYIRYAGYMDEAANTYYLPTRACAEAIVVEADPAVEEPTVVYGVDFEIINCTYGAAKLALIGDGTYSFTLNGTSNGKTYTKADAPRTLSGLSSGGTLTVTRVEDGAALTITFSRPAALTGTFGTTKATSPAVADGTITGVTDGVAYEINSVSDATGDANWTAATVENGAIVGLVPGSYYIRCAGYMDEAANTYYLPTRAYAEALVVGSNFELAATPVLGEDVTVATTGYGAFTLTFLTAGDYTYELTNRPSYGVQSVTVTEVPYPVYETGANGTTVLNIVRKGDGTTTADSEPLTIPFTSRPAAPTNLTGVAPTTIANNNGKITGLDANASYVYSDKASPAEEEWISVEAGATEITGLVPGTYVVCFAADGNTTLHSSKATVTVAEFVATQEAAPTDADVTLVATGDNTANLTFVGAGTFTYQVDSAEAVVGAGTVELTDLADGFTVTIIRKGDGETTLDSDALVFTLTKAAAPAGLTVVDCENAEDATGEITGLDANTAYQYKAVDAGETNVEAETTALENPVEGAYVVYGTDGWIDVEAGATEITLVPGTYAVRVAPNGTTLASEAATYTVAAYEAPVEPDVAQNGDNLYKTLQAAIEDAQAGDTITLLASVDEAVTVAKAVTIVKNGFTAELTVDGTTYGKVDTGDAYVVYPMIGSLAYRSLLLKDMIQINYKPLIANFGDFTEEEVLANGKVLVWTGDAALSDDPADFLIGSATEVKALEIGYEGSTKVYAAKTEGIAAKNMGDVQKYRFYIVDEDGIEHYSELKEYSPLTYCQTKYNSTASADKALKPLVIALMNYGAAAQVHFEYKTDVLMNSFLTEAEQKITDDYTATDLKTDVAGKYKFDVTNVINQGVDRSVVLVGAIEINLRPYLYSQYEAGDLTLLYWSEATYDAVDELTEENADLVTEFVKETGKKPLAKINGIAAKDLGKTCYYCVKVELNGETYYSDLRTYSAHQYAVNTIAKATSATVTEALKDVCRSILAYSNAAETYFANNGN